MQVRIGPRQCHAVRRFAFTKVLSGHRCYIDRGGFKSIKGIGSCYGRASEVLDKLNLVYDNQI